MREIRHLSGRFAGAGAPGAVPCVVLLSALLLIGCGGSGDGAAASTSQAAAGQHERDEPEKDAIAVRVGEVVVEPLSSIYSTSATLRADKQAQVTARTNGVVRKLEVEEGDPVEEGTPLVYLEDEEQKIEFDRASTVRETRVREYDRARRLHEQDLMSEEEFEAIRRDWEEAVHAADLAELLLSRTVIRAPFSGRVLRRHIDVGVTVSNGTAVYDLADLDPLYADVNVPEQEVARLHPGQRVRLSADPTKEATLARIERIAPVVDVATGTVKVTLAVDGRSDLRPGSFTRVEIVTDTHEQALVVLRAALVAEGRRWYLFRVQEDGKHVERLEITRGYEEGDKVEVLETVEAETPLRPGDQVVVVGASALTDGAAVQVAQPEKAQDDASADNSAADEAGRVAA
jgi:membrane fusion protein (multidrug efflux system)